MKLKVTLSPFEFDGRCAGSSRSGWNGYAVLLGDTDRAVGYLNKNGGHIFKVDMADET